MKAAVQAAQQVESRSKYTALFGGLNFKVATLDKEPARAFQDAYTREFGSLPFLTYPPQPGPDGGLER